MKPVFAVIVLAATLGAYAQTTPIQDSMQADVHRQILQRPPGQNDVLSLQAVKPNEIQRNGVSYSGILIQLGKTDNPAQLINPAAPPAYGSPEDNTVWDPVTGEGRGLKLFSISF